MRDVLTASVGELLAEGEADWVMVDSLIGTAEEHAEVHGGDSRDISVELLGELLTEGLMEIGDLRESGFEAWTCSVEESLARSSTRRAGSAARVPAGRSPRTPQG
ncbi:hypothetical protein [Streptomyces armeniacus]|nr:hypothetical protein [Streptomyces armeniacus]